MPSPLCEPLFSFLSDFYIHLALFIDDISSAPLCMFFCVTLTTHKAKVVIVQCDARIVYVPGIQVDDVMHDLSGGVPSLLQALLAQAGLALEVRRPAILPGFTVIKIYCVGFHRKKGRAVISRP